MGGHQGKLIGVCAFIISNPNPNSKKIAGQPNDPSDKITLLQAYVWHSLFEYSYSYLPSNITTSPFASNFWGLDVVLSYNGTALPGPSQDNDTGLEFRDLPSQNMTAIIDSGVLHEKSLCCLEMTPHTRYLFACFVPRALASLPRCHRRGFGRQWFILCHLSTIPTDAGFDCHRFWCKYINHMSCGIILILINVFSSFF